MQCMAEVGGEEGLEGGEGKAGRDQAALEGVAVALRLESEARG